MIVLFSAFNSLFAQSLDSVLTIPVVVHVLYETQHLSQNINDNQIISQISVLNKDYNKNNSDTVITPQIFKSLASSAAISFCLASKTPDGLPTNGITRTETSLNEIGMTTSVYYSAMGGHDAWDTEKYLNIWVCELDGNVLGYASFPGASIPQEDGIVIDYRNFGTTGTVVSPYHKGRTTTHEVGHWLGLKHIWGSSGGCLDDDGISDTPDQEYAYYGCPTFPQSTCGSTDMYMNFMDYVDDNCMNLFTIEQTAFMRNTLLDNPRTSLPFSDGCTEVRPVVNFNAYDTVVNVGNIVNFFDESSADVISWEWTFPGGFPNTSNQQNPSVLYAQSGSYDVQLTVGNGFYSEVLIKPNYIEVSCLPFEIDTFLRHPDCQPTGEIELTPLNGSPPLFLFLGEWRFR